MKLDIENERVNRLLHRTELRCRIETDGTTPSRQDIIKQISAKKGVNENLVIVDMINQEYGKKVASAYVKVYESEKAAQTIENKHKIEKAKKAMEGPKQKKDAPAETVSVPEGEEAKPEEAPVEEKAETEEKPVEEAKSEEAAAEELKKEERPKAEEAPAEKEKKEGEE